MKGQISNVQRRSQRGTTNVYPDFEEIVWFVEDPEMFEIMVVNLKTTMILLSSF